MQYRVDLLKKLICENDLTEIKRLLKTDPILAQAVYQESKFYDEFAHWIYKGDTALHFAAAAHHSRIVKILITSEADPNAANNHRNVSPLHYAADSFPGSPNWKPKQQIKTIQTLLQAGSEIDAQDKNGATALHRAVRTRSAAAVTLLLETGSDPKIKNKSGSTPFHLAVQNTGRGGSGSRKAKEAQRQIIQTFLEFGVNPSLKNGNGKSVLDSAKSEWIREMLISG